MSAFTRIGERQPCSPWALQPHVDGRLDELIRRTVRDLAGPLAGPLLRVVGAAGKRLRPAVTLAVGGLAQRGTEVAEPGRSAIQLAAAVELVHCATLVHDDLIDAAPTRRGVPTVNAGEGGPSAVVGGDLLIAAATLLAGQVSQRAAVVIAETIAALCRGEAMQAQLRYEPDVTVETLIEVARLKTGALLRGASVLGADAVDAEPSVREAAAAFGTSFGVCLQLVDDVLDIASTPARFGKPVGADFGAGTMTVPAVLALVGNPDLAELLRPDLDAVSRQRAVNLLQHADEALASTVTMARRYAKQADDVLTAVLPPVIGTPSAAPLCEWPGLFLDVQLATKVSDRHRWLLPLRTPTR